MKITRWLTVLLSFWFVLSLQASRAQVGDAKYSQVQDVPRQEINDWIKSEVERSGGNWSKDRYAFLVGFSTGHYGQDPVHAIAMRRLAFSLLNNTLTAGDSVASMAWEMQAWDKTGYIPLDTDPASRRKFVDAVPYTTQQGSKGGHDTERAMFDALTTEVSADQADSTIILLLTNSNQSQGPTGEKAALFGKNNPQLTEAMEKLGYRTPPARQSFRLKTKSRNLNVDITALFPKALKSLPNSGDKPRYPTFAQEFVAAQRGYARHNAKNCRMRLEAAAVEEVVRASDGSVGGGNGGSGSGGGGNGGGTGVSGTNGTQWRKWDCRNAERYEWTRWRETAKTAEFLGGSGWFWY